LEKLAKGAGVSVYDLFSPTLPALTEIKKKPSTPHYQKRAMRKAG
jgi:hypothetical protein